MKRDTVELEKAKRSGFRFVTANATTGQIIYAGFCQASCNREASKSKGLVSLSIREYLQHTHI